MRLMIQQSNCFLVVERGVGMQNMMQERALAKSGELRQDSNVGGGQMVSADYVLTPAIVFSENNAGGVGGGVGGVVGGLFGRGAGAIGGGVAGGLQFKEAQTSMLVADARSGIQVAAAEGSAKKADFRLGGLLGGAGIGGGGVAALGGYANTNEGKVIAASFADNYNGIVRSVRGNPSLQRKVASLSKEAGNVAKAGATYDEGDVLRPKIGNVKLFSKPADDAALDDHARQGRRDDLHRQGAGRLREVETSKGARLGEEDPRHQVAGARGSSRRGSRRGR